ncbi:MULTISPECIES: hypothetical protein [unclassified Streptomyces]|uniref:hypothetical protein n=1 Tax=unclassified Streptomyces TaxID=2593676 RepID=UPI002DD9F5B4|nr:MULTISPECIES: hypothetical protein [unclassified Streptomyces]WSA90160.1 hypothetical protein OIE63_00405 [Streptomyces sp. NBC_01795]WSB74389.1 hypothetical protein OHB04_00400 [Streptomyces sp. NBC_01775]WSS17229.1 hypothetical protein OG533_38995 [Streptomyces sp. NBC_01186]WSS45973.1 hypothetical protein OG220_39245 [Streptomyces sp. NBC_01187]
MANNEEPREPRVRSWKRDLPFPYDRDLSGVLRHLNRRTRAFRTRLANDPVTASYLAAGMRLLGRHLGPGAYGERRFLSFLSQRVVAAEVDNNPRPFTRRGSVAALRDRWSAQSDFVADLIRFAVWRENYRPGSREQRAVNTRKLVGGPDFVRAVHETAYQHTAEGVEMPSVRLGLALMTVAEGDEEVMAAISDMYEDYLGSWKELYAAVIRERGLRLRPGLTLDDLANALSAVTDGMILRAIGDPGSGVVDHANRRSLMGTVALAVIHAFLEPDDDAASLTLEQAVAARFDNRAY